MRFIKLCMSVMLMAIAFSTCSQEGVYTASGDSLGSLLPLSSILKGQTAIYMYNGGSGHNGLLGGRAGADALCATALPIPLLGKTPRAFLSVSISDEVRDVVPVALQTLPVVDVTGAFTISSSWAALWDGNIDMILSAAGVLPGGAEYWSGSQLTGTRDGTSQCQGWTDNTLAWAANRGNSNFTDFNWIQFGAAVDCTTAQYILCVAY